MVRGKSLRALCSPFGTEDRKGETMADIRKLNFYGKNRTDRETWDQVIGNRIPFDAGNMHARPGTPDDFRNATGELPAGYREEFKSGSPDYVVWSYRTPIMWHDSETGKWRFPRVSYSATTTQHQAIAEYAIKCWDGEKWNTPDTFDDSGEPESVPCGGR